MSCRSIPFVILATAFRLAADDPAPISGVLRDFSNLPADFSQSHTRWNWTPEQKSAAAGYSRLEAAQDPDAGQTVLKLTVRDTFPWRGNEGERMSSLNATYLPPVADTIRLTVRMVSGHMEFSVGGPTVYFGHSDVHTAPVRLAAEEGDGWRTVEFDLNRGLRRNFRRAEWAANSPVIYYSRWVQEPVHLIVLPGSVGEMRIAKAEWVSRGEGRPFASLAGLKAEPVGAPVRFDETESRAAVFTLYSGARESPDFSAPPRPPRVSWIPPRIDFEPEGSGGPVALRSIHKGVEEACWTGVKLEGAAGANALALDLQVEHPRQQGDLVIDFLLIATPDSDRAAFPWAGLAPPDAWRAAVGVFDVYLSPTQPALKTTSFALFHARRSLPQKAWTEVLLPMDDFVCIYGQGAMVGAFSGQKSPEAGQILALAFLSPYGQRSAETTVRLRQVRFMKIDDPAAPLRSYWVEPVKE